MSGNHIALTGPTGFVGSNLTPALTASGHNLHRLDLRSLPAKLPKADLLIHLAAIAHRPDSDRDDAAYFKVNRDLALDVARKAAEAGVHHMIQMSTAKVSGGATEDTFSTARDPYTRSKMEAEIGLEEIQAETGMHITCFRPPVIYGPGVKGNIARLLDKIERRSMLPSGALRARRSVLGVRNLATAIEHVLERPNGFQVFHVADAEPVTTGQLVSFAAQAMGVRPRLIPVPAAAIKIGGTLLGRGRDVERLTEDSIIDTSRLRATGWNPWVTTREGFAEAAHAYRGGHT